MADIRSLRERFQGYPVEDVRRAVQTTLNPRFRSARLLTVYSAEVARWITGGDGSTEPPPLPDGAEEGIARALRTGRGLRGAKPLG